MTRRCYDCRQPIRARERWSLGEREGIQTPVHRDCGKPEPEAAPLLDWLEETTPAKPKPKRKRTRIWKRKG